MTLERLQPIRPLLLSLAILGFLLINCPFLYFVLMERAVYQEAMRNGMALLFMGEAFLLMFLLAFLIHRLGWRNPGWLLFIVMSLVGSLAFSIPLQLYLLTRRRNSGPAIDQSR